MIPPRYLVETIKGLADAYRTALRPVGLTERDLRILASADDTIAEAENEGISTVEGELMDLIHNAPAKFTLKILRRDGQWQVAVDQAGGNSTGRGVTFQEAIAGHLAFWRARP